ncbi:MAG: OmpA family protein [Bacteroidota bacterium]
MQKPTLYLLVLVLLFFSFHTGTAQESKGRWALGFHGGANMWFNDYNERTIGPGGEMMLRYGITRGFSAGLLAGYEELKSKHTPPYTLGQFDYLKLHAIPAAFVGWVHFAPGSKVNPYFYGGVGAMIYKRLTGNAVYVPNGDSRFSTSILVPVGLGLEIFASKKTAFIIEAGYRITDDYPDGIKAGKLGGYGTAKAGVNIYLGSSDADDDDEDGLNNGEERTLGTNPLNPDTDGDGLKDGDEAHRYKTNPTKNDTDGDGLNDGDEVMKFTTDPNKGDTDGDGLLDGDEVNQHKTDPLKTDTDGGGLSDGDEIMKYKSDPLKLDTDGDGLSDKDEVMTHKTDPAKSDTDGDGLSDSDEIRKHKTDPLKSDTDGGGIADGAEVTRGTNPLNPKDDVLKETIILERGKTTVLRGVNFEFNKATLTKDSEKILEMAYDALVAQPDLKVLIAGHTDAVGSDAYNQKLSLRRAQSVKTWLVKKGIASNVLTVTGKGEDEPIDSNDTDDGRANNRRIEFRVLK